MEAVSNVVDRIDFFQFIEGIDFHDIVFQAGAHLDPVMLGAYAKRHLVPVFFLPPGIR